MAQRKYNNKFRILLPLRLLFFINETVVNGMLLLVVVVAAAVTAVVAVVCLVFVTALLFLPPTGRMPGIAVSLLFTRYAAAKTGPRRTDRDRKSESRRKVE